MSEDLSKYKSLFLQSADEYIVKLFNSLLKLSGDPNNKEELNNLFISAHSLKGQSLTMGYEKTGALALAIEQKIREIKDVRGLTPQEFTTISEAAEVLKKSLAGIAGDKEEPDATEIIRKISQ